MSLYYPVFLAVKVITVVIALIMEEGVLHELVMMRFMAP
ncbi:Uncharacterised protein [Serratia plymuthica]|nr:Uncharacterised protein [Serratia plymuthica]